MTEPDAPNPETDDLGLIPPQIQAPRDREFHGKQPPRPDDDYLAHRTEQERIEVGLDDYDPDEVPPATD